MVNVDPQLISFVILSFFALLIGTVLRIFKQPSVIAYILTGLILGPFGLKIIKNPELITHLGNFGVVLLLFFAGMEMDLSKLVSKWRIAIIGTVLQIIISLTIVFGLGYYLNWTLGRIVLMGFVISLSSTAVVLKILESKNEMNTKIGQEAISILLVQDVAIIPMMIILSLVGDGNINYGELRLQIIGSIIAIIFIIWLLYKKTVNIPFSERFKDDPELQVLAALVLCFGIATLSGLFRLSTALGAFIAGLFLASTKETAWVHHSLQSFKVIFLALFFMSVGMLIDVQFFISNILMILFLLFFVFMTNTLINALIFRWNKNPWRESLYGGSILAQVGEFSFILAAIGLSSGLINNFGYKLTIIIIALSLMISPFWIRFFCSFIQSSEKMLKKKIIPNRIFRGVKDGTH